MSCRDGVNSVDATLILQQRAGVLAELPCPEAGDVNGDGSSDAVDASLILQLDAGLLDALPGAAGGASMARLAALW